MIVLHIFAALSGLYVAYLFLRCHVDGQRRDAARCATKFVGHHIRVLAPWLKENPEAARVLLMLGEKIEKDGTDWSFDGFREDWRRESARKESP